MIILQNVFLAVINMSITASYVFVFIQIARLLLKKTPRSISYILCSAMLFRLLCPVSIPAAFSLLRKSSLFDSFYSASADFGMLHYLPSRVESFANPQFEFGLPIITNHVNEILSQPLFIQEINLMQLTIKAFAFLWLAGCVLMLLCAGVSYGRLKRKLRTAVKLHVHVYESSAITTPFVCGWRRPNIYLPVGLSGDILDHVLKHENMHIRRLDNIFKTVSYVALVIHWMNPLVWWAFSLMSKDMEMSCDEQVITQLGVQDKAAYSRSLLLLSLRKRIFTGTPLAFGEGHVKSRVRHALKFRKPVAWAKNLALAACVCLIASCVTNPVGAGAAYTDPALDPVLDNAISQAVISKFRHLPITGECETEGHLIFLKEETGNTVKVYGIVSYMVFEFANGIFTEGSGGYNPAVLTFNKTPDGSYMLKEYVETSMGSEYGPSIQRMFPTWLRTKMMTCDQYYDALFEQELQTAKAYLESKGIDAPIMQRHDINP